MEPYLILLFGLPIAGLLLAMILLSRTPRDFTIHSHLNTLREHTRPHP